MPLSEKKQFDLAHEQGAYKCCGGNSLTYDE